MSSTSWKKEALNCNINFPLIIRKAFSVRNRENKYYKKRKKIFQILSHNYTCNKIINVQKNTLACKVVHHLT